MGYDLRPKNDGCAKMVYEGGESEVHWSKNAINWGRYNVTGWIELRKYLSKHGLGGIQPSFNDGEEINGLDCLKIAEVLDMAKGDDSWLQGHANWWRTCGGCWVL